MKKLTALILALALLSSIASAATVSHQHHPENVVYMGGASNTYIVASDEGYQIFAADGTNAGPVWGNMGPKQNGAIIRCSTMVASVLSMPRANWCWQMTTSPLLRPVKIGCWAL